MAGRKSPRNRRKWSLEEIERVRYLRNVLGWTFPQIGREMCIDPDKCRMVYHTGRYVDVQDRLTISEVCRELNIPRTRYERIRGNLQAQRLPHRPEDVRATVQEMRHDSAEMEG